MKNILLTILALFTALPLIAQEPTGFENKIHRNVQEKANPKEGIEKFREDFIAKLDLSSVPVELEKITIKIRFTVERDGSFSNIRMMENEYGLEDNAIEVLKNMPPWNPAKHEGEIVRSVYTISMAVKIQDRVEEDNDDVIYKFVQQPAKPVGGSMRFREEFKKKYDEMGFANPKSQYGLSTVRFIVGKDGTLSDFSVVRGNPYIGLNIIEVLKTMPKWRPAKQHDKLVRSSFTWSVKIGKRAE